MRVSLYDPVMTSSPALEVNGLTKLYGDFRAVDDVSFVVPKGKVVGLLGPNGAGKTTTIQMLIGITESTAGEVRYFGDDFKTHRQKCLQRINFTSAYNSLQGQIPVRQNLIVFCHLYSVDDPKRRVDELCDQFELAELMDQTYWSLSAGQRARVNLAKALVNDPQLIMMDEPTSSLDPDIRDKVLAIISELRASRGLSLLYTSHNMDEVSRICDEVIFLQHGVIVKQDTPSNLTREIGHSRLVVTFDGSSQSVERFLKDSAKTFVFEDVRRVAIETEEAAIPACLSGISGLDDVQVTEVEVRKPSLEDVFLNVARRHR